MTTREQAMQWWDILSYTTKNKLFISYYGEDRENFKGLISSEIEEIFRKEKKITENIYLNRLKEQYKKYYKVDERDSFEKLVEKVEYNAMRLFCLDTQLLSINAIENMELEINSSF